MSGHLSHLVAITALSTLRESFGKPSMIQSRIEIGVSSVADREYVSEQGTSRVLSYSSQPLTRNSL
jgi:hypothetical protein